MGGADVIRQALDAGLVDELSIIIAPVVLGGGKHLFDGFTRSLELEHIGARQSPYATFIDYRVKAT
jgi:dihydrofolate reductase